MAFLWLYLHKALLTISTYSYKMKLSIFRGTQNQWYKFLQLREATDAICPAYLVSPGVRIVRGTNSALNKYLLKGGWKEPTDALKFIHPCPIN